METVDPFEDQRKREEEEQEKSQQPEIHTPDLPLEDFVPDGKKNNMPPLLPFDFDIDKLVREDRDRVGNA